MFSDVSKSNYEFRYYFCIYLQKKLTPLGIWYPCTTIFDVKHLVANGKGGFILKQNTIFFVIQISLFTQKKKKREFGKEGEMNNSNPIKVCNLCT